MNNQEYQRRALALESHRFDGDRALFPAFDVASLIATCRQLDLLKRELYYDKKPDKTKQRQYTDESNEFYQQAINLDDDLQMVEELSLMIPPRLLHALIGLTTEVGEMWEAVLTAVKEGRLIDLDNLREELSDLRWYMALGLDEAEKLDGNRGRFTQESIQAANIAKLEKRYEKGTQTSGGDRDIAAERAAMNGV